MLPFGIGGHRLFALRINCDSMKEAGVIDGDIIIAKEMNTPEIGEIVVALVENDEATVKYFYLAYGKVELRPANKRYQSQFYEYDQIQVQGIVVSLYRKF